MFGKPGASFGGEEELERSNDARDQKLVHRSGERGRLTGKPPRWGARRLCLGYGRFPQRELNSSASRARCSRVCCGRQVHTVGQVRDHGHRDEIRITGCAGHVRRGRGAPLASQVLTNDQASHGTRLQHANSITLLPHLARKVHRPIFCSERQSTPGGSCHHPVPRIWTCPSPSPATEQPR